MITKIRHNQKGQVLVIFGLAFVLLIGIVGLATDSAYAYFRSIQVERAAAAAALAGVPLMPQNFNTPSGSNNASARAILEAKRNGFDAATPGVTVTPAKTGNFRELAVTITAPSPVFFLSALGVKPITISRKAVAGYKPPIALGQPGGQSGSGVAELGVGTHFYYDIYKGWNNQRSEGDAFTPNPDEFATNGFVGAQRSKDVHQFSLINGIEAPELDCTSGAFKMPCRGGYNWRVIIPDGQQGQVQVYNAAYAPDFGSKRNNCDNSRNLTSCNTLGERYHEDDNGSRCYPNCDATQAKNFTATGYTLLAVPDIFLRSQDTVLSQTVVSPIDATNYDGAGGANGGGSTAVPSYHNVLGNNDVTQYYDASGQPCNMRIYHAWVDIANYDGSNLCAGIAGATGDNLTVAGVTKTLVQRKCGGLCASKCTYCGATAGTLGGGTYRLRVDGLNADGSFNTGLNADGSINSGATPIDAKASKGYAVRVVDPSTGLPCTGCEISGWQDMCVYTPINAGTGVVPLFQLTKDYAGVTIDVDIFDVGDSGGKVDLAILDPSGRVATTGDGSLLPVSNDGISRLGPVQKHLGNQYPMTRNTGLVPKIDFTDDQAGYQAADNPGYVDSAGNKGPEYQGSWIRLSIPIPGSYDPSKPVAGSSNPVGYDYWSLQYKNTSGANDTFTFTVSARGGPVHLVQS